MRDGNRATRSAALLAGFWLVAWAQVVVALALVLLVLALLPAPVALRIGAPLCIAPAGLLWFATSRALRVRHATPAGVPVSRADAPALWSLIDAAAVTARAAPPDGITVIADARVWAGERFRLIGLIGGRRELYLGLPLLQAWDLGRLRAAVAHELAHGSTELGRLAPTAYRGRLAVARIVRRIPRRSPAGPLLRAYARMYRRLDAPLAWAQELAADRAAAAFAGPRAAVAVLRDGPALEGMQQLFLAEYLSPGWQAGFVPEDVFGGLLRVLAARPEEMTRLRALPPPTPLEGDPHPPLADRLTALTALVTPGAADEPAAGGAGPAVSSATAGPSGAPASAAPPPAGTSPVDAAATLPAGTSAVGTSAVGASPAGSSPAGMSAAGMSAAADEAAGELVPDLPGLGRALQAVAFPAAGRTVVDWDEFFSATRNAEMEREADAALRAIGHAVGAPVPGLAAVLDLVADGRLPKAAATVFAGLPPAETTERIADLITLLLALAALRSGAARWRHSWTGTAELVAIDGSHLDLGQPAALAADPATVHQARARLADLGIDLAAAARPDPGRRPARVPVHGGVVNVLADGARTDVLILETGLLLIPALPRSRNGDGRRRLARLAAAGIHADGSLVAAPRATDLLAAALLAPTGQIPTVDAAARAAGDSATGTAFTTGIPYPSGGGGSLATTAGSSPGSGWSVDASSAGRGSSGGRGSFGGGGSFGIDPSVGGGSSGGDSPFGGDLPSGSDLPSGGGSFSGSGSPFSGGSPSGGASTGGRGSAAGPPAGRPATAEEPTGSGPSSDRSGSLGRNRFILFADVVRAAVMQGRRRQWELTTADGSVLTLRTTLDSDELHGGWSALDEAVSFLTRTRAPAATRDSDHPPTAEASAPPPPGRDPEPASPAGHRGPSPTPAFAPPSFAPATAPSSPATTPSSAATASSSAATAPTSPAPESRRAATTRARFRDGAAAPGTDDPVPASPAP